VAVQRLHAWSNADEKEALHGAEAPVVTAEQMELKRLRKELERVKMERDILRKATAYFAKESL
jgi:transposase